MQDAVPTILAVLVVAALLYLPIHLVRRALAARRARRMAKAFMPVPPIAPSAPAGGAALAVARARVEILEERLHAALALNAELERNAVMRAELCDRYARIIETLSPGALRSAERPDVEVRDAA